MVCIHSVEEILKLTVAILLSHVLRFLPPCLEFVELNFTRSVVVQLSHHGVKL